MYTRDCWSLSICHHLTDMKSFPQRTTLLSLQLWELPHPRSKKASLFHFDSSVKSAGAFIGFWVTFPLLWINTVLPVLPAHWQWSVHSHLSLFLHWVISLLHWEKSLCIPDRSPMSVFALSLLCSCPFKCFVMSFDVKGFWVQKGCPRRWVFPLYALLGS